MPIFQLINSQAKLLFNEILHEIIKEHVEFELNFAHRHRERQQRQHDIDRENVEIERLQQQQNDRPLSIDDIFDINIDNIQNNNDDNQDNDQNNDQNLIDDQEIDDYWRRRNLQYQEQRQAIDAYNAQLQPRPNQAIPFELIDDLNPDVDENNNNIF